MSIPCKETTRVSLLLDIARLYRRGRSLYSALHGAAVLPARSVASLHHLKYKRAVVQCGCEHAWCGVRMAAMRAVGVVWMGELG